MKGKYFWKKFKRGAMIAIGNPPEFHKIVSARYEKAVIKVKLECNKIIELKR